MLSGSGELSQAVSNTDGGWGASAVKRLAQTPVYPSVKINPRLREPQTVNSRRTAGVCAVLVRSKQFTVAFVQASSAAPHWRKARRVVQAAPAAPRRALARRRSTTPQPHGPWRPNWPSQSLATAQPLDADLGQLVPFQLTRARHHPTRIRRFASIQILPAQLKKFAEMASLPSPRFSFSGQVSGHAHSWPART